FQFSFYTLFTIPLFALFPYTTLFRSRFHFRPVRLRIPELRAVDDRLHRLPQISIGVEERFRDPIDERLRRIVRHQALAELIGDRSEEHTSELQSRGHLVCRLLLEKKK